MGWTWTGLDADTKLCVSYLVGGRGADWAMDFMKDCASRIKGRVQSQPTAIKRTWRQSKARLEWNAITRSYRKFMVLRQMKISAVILLLVASAAK
ncbi:MAG: hypothetical protein DMG84_23880 [Acidobacteria bacterium]|nr:MAG: hypothetical protein DMG84_23880 [Acidobacteriota bacterium]